MAEFRYGDIEIEITTFGDEIDAVIRKGDRVYVYPVDEINEKLDNMIPGWYSVYAQEEAISEDELSFYI